MNLSDDKVERHYRSFEIDDVLTFKQKMLSWSKQFNIFCFLDNHHYQLPYQTHECLLAVGSVKVFVPEGDFFKSLSEFYRSTNDWIFGHFNYDLKNKIEGLESNNIDYLQFPEINLFVPAAVLKIDGNRLQIGSLKDEAETVFNEIQAQPVPVTSLSSVKITSRISREHYIETIEKLRKHILNGDCYEINFCQEFFSANCNVDPLSVYQNLTAVSPNPFSAFYKVDDNYLICASPERFIKKERRKVISQPIKGTIKRDLDDAVKDKINLEALKKSEKERSENVMIVDLVRNDLSKVCREGTVRATDLYGIYSFPQVHQMVSTVEGELKNGADLPEIIHAAFPMGSMTGAPKKKVMELIEQYEETKRGIYSGAVGYITPEKDFDFNVVIRSIVYNQQARYISYHVGSAITYNSNPVEEYNECLLKAAAIKKVLQ